MRIAVFGPGDVGAPEWEAALGELLVRSFVENYARVLPAVAVTESRKRELRDVAAMRREGALVVAFAATAEEESPIGGLTLFPPGRTHRAWIEGGAEIRYLAVEPGSPREVARELMAEAHRIAFEAWKVPAICLHVRSEALGVARFYERLGYRREPDHDVDDRPEIRLDAYVLPRGVAA